MHVRPEIGMRVHVNERFPYGGHGRNGTIVFVPHPGRAEWIGVEFDDNPGRVVEWHRDYFDAIPDGQSARYFRSSCRILVP